MIKAPRHGRPTPTGADSAHHARALLRFLQARRTTLSPLLILTHDYPDPDALAAAFGLRHLAEAGCGIQTCIAYRGEIGRMENKTMVRLLRIPLRKFTPGLLARHTNVALVDTQPAFTNNPFPESQRATLLVDQHPAVAAPLAELAILDPDCGATCAIVAQALLQSGLALPARVATALAYGILTDTLNLYRAHRHDTVETYLRLLEKSDMRVLARIQNPVRPRRFFASLAKGIIGARLHRRLVVTHLGAVDTPDRVAQVAEFLLAYQRVRWCLVTGRYQGRLHVSLRTAQAQAEAGEILRDVFEDRRNAGGHGPIAGGCCQVGVDAAENVWKAREKSLTARLICRLRIPATCESYRPFAS